MTKASLIIALTLAPAMLAAQGPVAQTPPTGAGRVAPSATAVRAAVAPQIDGRLDDAIWAQAPVIDQFTQRDPADGQPASERTEVRIAYDDEALYIGARLHDRSPVTDRLGRRDMPNRASDWLRISLDSFKDRRNAFRFEVNPSGVRRDAIISGGFGGGGFGGVSFIGDGGDVAWDAVWDAGATIDSGGWSAEMRIPFSQLRFSPADEQSWGFQAERIIDRTQEIALFSYSPKSEQGGVATFADLTGLRGIRPGRPLELIPYVLSEGDFVDTGSNPFRSDRELELNAGLDARYRVTSNLTLSATVNPDFGQVEVDPAIINLTAFETRFQELRPFFVEGSNSFRLGGGVGGPGASAATLLYSRRIGRAPQLGVPSGQADIPGTTDILAAGKLTGKTANGWSLGLVNAVTGRAEGRYLEDTGVERRAEVEPLTNYFAGRLNREFRQGRTTFGGMLTSTNRDVSDARVESALRSNAYSGGVDFIHDWANRSWSVGGFAVASHVQGSAASILATQRSSTRYYQRPDSDVLDVDAGATSLSGYAATVQFNKRSGVHWTGDWWVSTISPGFEINDIGFQQRADRIASGGGIRYSEREPGSFLRQWNVFLAGEPHWNYDGDRIDGRTFLTVMGQHLNYWTLQGTFRLEPARMDDRLTRGGPIATRPTVRYLQGTLTSDPRKNIGGDLQLSRQTDAAGGEISAAEISLDVRTSPQWNLSIGPRLTHVEQHAQYVTAVPDALATATYGTRYIFAPLKQTEFSVVGRLNYTFTPDLTLEMYAQPLVSNGDYGTPMEFRAPGTFDFATYGTDQGTIVRNGNRFSVDPDGTGPARAFQVADRSFTTRSLRGNAVLRWEYRPGSTFYLVWQQERLNPELVDDFQVAPAFGSLFEGSANNVLVLKWSYWFNP